MATGKIVTLQDGQNVNIYPETSAAAVYMNDGKSLEESVITYKESEESIILNTPDLVKKINDIENNISFLDRLKLKLVYNAKCMGGNIDDTEAIQNYINDVDKAGGGIVYLPFTGEVTIRGISFTPKTFSTYNKIEIVGLGLHSTILVADDNSNDVFVDYGGYYTFEGSTNTVRNQTGHVNFRNIGFKCKATKSILCFNQSVTQYCDLENVWIEGFKNGAIRFEDSYDCNFYNVQAIKCGKANSSTKGNYAYSLYFVGKRDTTNALHFTNCRFEFTPMFIGAEVDEEDPDTISTMPCRHIYFDNCKFEKSRTNLIGKRPIYLKAHNEVGFNNCFFVNGNDTAGMSVDDNGQGFIALHHNESSFLTGTYQIQTTQFSNCEFVTGRTHKSNWGSFNNCDMVNVTFNNCYGGSGSSLEYCLNFYNNNSAKNLKIRGINSKLINFVGSNNNIEVQTLHFDTFYQKCFQLSEGAERNILTINNFINFDINNLNNYPSLLGTGYSIGTNLFTFNTNKISIKNLSSNKIHQATNKPIVYDNDTIFVNANFIDYFNYGSDGQIITVINKYDNGQIVNNSNRIVTKTGSNYIMKLDEIVRFINITNVWYQL